MAYWPTTDRSGTPPLPREQFLEVVARAPLVSIDLVVRDGAGRVLLGLRRNAPARGWWFVPGGAIRKNETLDIAFGRICRNELGRELRRNDSRLLGVYEHFYPENADDRPGFGTHYVVLGHELSLGEAPSPPPDQHSVYRWLEPAELLNTADVHENTKAYFR
jgi:colanic acid biosynthesis protein WcaH